MTSTSVLNQHVCTQCHYVGASKKDGSALIEFILWCCAIVPGLLYSTWRRSQQGNILCPKCGSKTLIPLDTPRAKTIIGEQEFENFSGKILEAQQVNQKIREKHTKFTKWFTIITLLFVAYSFFRMLI